jgi:hypothetical protein
MLCYTGKNDLYLEPYLRGRFVRIGFLKRFAHFSSFYNFLYTSPDFIYNDSHKWALINVAGRGEEGGWNGLPPNRAGVAA